MVKNEQMHQHLIDTIYQEKKNNWNYVLLQLLSWD